MDATETERVGRSQPLLNRIEISDDALKWVFLLPAVLILAFLSIYPFLMGVWMSLHNWSLAGSGIAWTGLGNYSALVADQRFVEAFKHTVVFTGVSVTIELLLGVGLAMYLKSLSERWRPIFRTVFLIPMVVTPIATALMWRLMINGQIGVLNYMLTQVGIAPPAWTSRPTMSMITIIIVDVWQWTPLITMIVFAGLLAVPSQLYEAARVDGAPRLAIFRHITLPHIEYMIAIALVFRLMRSFRTFPIIWLLTNGGPGTSTEILNVYLYRVAFVYLKGGKAAAIGILLLILTIGTTTAILRYVGVQ
ncbi:MAG: carbohydrate ABC transporter permease [Haloplanus sp.]